MEKKPGAVACVVPPSHHLIDAQILAKTIASTDSLVRRLHESQQENTKMKFVMETVRKTASKCNKLYTKERDKRIQSEEALQRIQKELESARALAEAQRHQITNMEYVHNQALEEARQSAAGESRSHQKVFSSVVREYLTSLQMQMESNELDEKMLVRAKSLRSSLEEFSWLREVLEQFPASEKKGKSEKLKRTKRKLQEEFSADDLSDNDSGEDGSVLIDAQRLEDLLEQQSFNINNCIESPESPKKVEKSFCDAGTMTTRITITRATNTEVKTADAATLFPEFTPPSSFEEIFSEMIVDLPELITEIPRAATRDACTETEQECSKSNAETLTDLCNIRKIIGYRKRKIQCQPESVKVENMKIEPVSPKPGDDAQHLQFQFEHLWSAMGQTLFAMLRNSTCDIVQSQYLLERENMVKQIFFEEMTKRENIQNDFSHCPLPLISQECEANPAPLDMPMEESYIAEPPEPAEEKIRKRIVSRKVPFKRKRSNVIVKSMKKIKLQRIRRERVPEQDEDSLEEFDLEKIREFYAIPELLEPIDDLPEDLLPSVTEKESICDKEQTQEPRAVSTRVSVMSFVHRHTAKRVKKPPDVRIVEKCRAVLLEYLQLEWISAELGKSVEKMMALAPKEDIIFEAVAGITEESSDHMMFNPFGSVAPLMPKTHQQMIIFCHSVGKYYPEGFLRRFLHSLERRMFTLTAQKKTLKNLVNITYLLIALMDLQFGEKHGRLSVRLFIFKCLYYFHHKAPPLIFMVLKAFPDALPVPSEGFEATETLLLALKCCLAHLPPLSNAETENPEFKKKELFYLLQTTYKCEPGRPSADETIGILMDRVREGNYRHVTHAFTLLAKRMGVKWAKTSLVHKHLIPCLNDVLLLTDQEPRNGQIVTLVDSISCIVKAFSNKDDMAEYHRVFACVLESIESHSVQEAAIAAFLRLSRFGMVNVFSQIYQWRAKMPISRELAAALDTFIHRKPKKFWLTLERQIN
ncbi:uncharacterized protein LOC132264298 [Phlebotomus argentipes]|uniref:uncharacterized protein LOC132264298 n=1 Tax=Phlebotomus argentipes TaxID=94469 RepID=UPI002892BDC4|nr:uncharacterized protein LOC132264298 [Phlebotomus argentipes]XP_059620411.1 uncharacterized protein LOC132264298 [Phlebotomus argentipes]